LGIAEIESKNRELEIEQSDHNEVFELQNGLIGYLLDVFITTQMSRSLYIADLDLRAAAFAGTTTLIGFTIQYKGQMLRTASTHGCQKLLAARVRFLFIDSLQSLPMLNSRR